MLHQSSASASPAATTTAATATGATGATGALAATAVGSTSASGSTGDGVNDPGVLPAPQSGQLLAFSRFRSKDPFTQQINIKCAGDAASSAGCGASTAAQPSGTTTTTGKTKPTGSGSTTRRREVSCVEPDLRARLADEEVGEDRNLGWLARGQQADGDAQEGRRADADEHRRRHALRAAAGLGQLDGPCGLLAG
ncbi:MAG: hypothetical protein E6G24_03110 [Actinobacteria bacterium]|nr:MAG: hypothetical protein E6G24_03110 [Actinomycetota bacterium]